MESSIKALIVFAIIVLSTFAILNYMVKKPSGYNLVTIKSQYIPYKLTITKENRTLWDAYVAKNEFQISLNNGTYSFKGYYKVDEKSSISNTVTYYINDDYTFFILGK